jgi:hypothetical protein
VPLTRVVGERLPCVLELQSRPRLLLEQELNAVNSLEWVSTAATTGKQCTMGSTASLASMVMVTCRAGCPGMGPTPTGVAFSPCSLGEVNGAWDLMRWRIDEGGAPARVCAMGFRNPMRPHYL